MDFRYVIKGAAAPEKVILFPLSDEQEEEALLDEVYARVSMRLSGSTGPVEDCTNAAASTGPADEGNALKHRGDALPFAIVGIFVPDWDRYLSPWEFEDERRHFSGEGTELLQYIRETLLPELKERFQAPFRAPSSSVSTPVSCPDIAQAPLFYIGGYSLSGLFCLWAALETQSFSGCASCSGSVWYPGFYDWALKKAGTAVSDTVFSTQSNRSPVSDEPASEAPKTLKIYLSLGTKEEKTRDPLMREVGNCTRGLYEHFLSDPARFSTVLEWNPGNHFKDVPERIAKGFAWLLDT